ncbi:MULTISPECIES: flagellar hook-length control protein FliK [Vagococcus]|uniref:Flagellar hook-length control protein FliK n=1 Tax=Vagococcus fluvialis bH819 TaxID=1255619 RepID=A0A1X6WRC0_9ENTE|nr:MULTISPECIES: flagellar hook-length control protein FliK [Vagococcus]SLM86883.1 Flagellar hook-length control protein FliK [Vagococcus fluvialis bH819]HCM88660.1 hypothetical protein [Vagococcus sp.]
MDVGMIASVNDNSSKKAGKKIEGNQDVFSDLLCNQLVANENMQNIETNENFERIMVNDESGDIKSELKEKSESVVIKDKTVKDELIEESKIDSNLNNYLESNIDLNKNNETEIKEFVISKFKDSNLSYSNTEISRESLISINLAGKSEVHGVRSIDLSELKKETNFTNINSENSTKSLISLEEQDKILKKESITNLTTKNNEINFIDLTNSMNASQQKKEISLDEPIEKINNQITKVNENDIDYQNYNMLIRDSENEVTKETSDFNQSKISGNSNFDTENMENIVTKIIRETDSLDSNNSKSFKITLKPENLGDLDVIIDMKDGKLIAKFIVDTPKVRELITHSLPMLQENLEKQNIVVSKTEVLLNLSTQSESQFEGNLDHRQQNQQNKLNSNKQIKQYDSNDELKKVQSNNNGDSVDILV